MAAGSHSETYELDWILYGTILWLLNLRTQLSAAQSREVSTPEMKVVNPEEFLSLFPLPKVVMISNLMKMLGILMCASGETQMKCA